MKGIRLLKLTLRDFQGGNFTLEANGEDVGCYGVNGAGKTRLMSAFSWLLFGKDSLGRSDFSIKNLDSTGEPEHNLQHSVEATLSINKVHIVLKKIFSEVWTKKRGSPESTFAGHTNEFYIDGVPSQKKEFDSKVSEIAGTEETFKLLTSPTIFPSLPWQKQRALLLEICGDLTDAQVIESDSKLSGLSEILGKHSLDDHRKVIAARRAEINKELEKIPVRIDEVRRGLPDISGLNRKDIEASIKSLETSLNDAKLRLQGIDTGGNIAELSKKLGIINHDIARIERDYYNDAMQVVNRLNQQITEITDKAQGAERQEKSIKEEMRQKQNKISSLENELVRLREKWVSIDAETFDDTTENSCPTCKRPLPSEQVEEVRNTGLANFNRWKAERLTKIESEGKAYASSVKIAKDDIEELHRSLPEIDNKNDELQPLITQRNAVKNMAENYESISERMTLIGQRTGIETAIKKEREGVSIDRGKINDEIYNLTAEVFTAKAEADKFIRRESGEKRIEELKTEEKKLAAEFEKLEKELYLTELFVKTKVSLLTEKINSRFEIARFKLFNVLVNGGVEECCEITVNGIPYNSGLNNGAKINAGLDVCQTLSRHYGLVAPIFIDNAESVCELAKMEAQVIRLVVKDDGHWTYKVDKETGTTIPDKWIPDDGKLRVIVSEQDARLRVETGKTQGKLL